MKFFLSQFGKVKRTAIAILIACTISLTGMGIITMASANGTSEIIAPETGFNAVAHYEFNDETNLGKDSLGNYDLVAKNVGIDRVNGGVALKDNGLLYAPALDEPNGDAYTDFSDLIKGSYSVSFRAYMRSLGGGGNYIVSTGSYGSHFCINWCYGGLSYSFGNGQNEDFGTNAANGNGQEMLNATNNWYRVNTIYNEKDLTVTVTATREGDSEYAFSKTHQLTAASTFGGNDRYSFTIGAQSHLGGWDDCHANAELGDGTVIYPNISDFRIYSGVIDATEIAAIAKYDADNLAAANAPTYEYNPIAAWDFSDSNNIGKDTYGNVDLIMKNTDAANYDLTDGVLTLKNNNFLYAGNLGNNQDISDKLSAFTIALDMKTPTFSNSAEYDIFSTARYADGFRFAACGNALRLYYGNGKSIVADGFFTADENDWQKVVVTGDIANKYIAVYCLNEGETEARLVGSASGDDVVFSTALCLTFGCWSKFGTEDTNYSNPSLANIKLYDFCVTSAQADQILTTGKVETTATAVKEIKGVTAQIEVSKDASETEILTVEGLPATTTVINEAGNALTANIVWIKVEKGDFSAKLTGFIFGAGVNNFANEKIELVVDYIVSNEDKQEIKPIVWYEFNDANNVGKDSMGNFDLVKGGVQSYLTHNAEDGYVTFEKPSEGDGAFLYSPAMAGATTDWSDLITGSYTVSVKFMTDNDCGGDRYIISASCYGDGFLVCGCYNGYEVYYSNGNIGGGTCHIRYETGNTKDRWVTLTVTYNANTGNTCLYLDGVLFREQKIEGYTGFAQTALYTFALGAQCDVNGSSAAQFFDGSIADVKIYDFALSATNVKDLITNEGTENALVSIANYYTVEEIIVDTTDINLVISADNSVEDVLAGIPATVTVKDSKGNAETCPVYWFGDNNGLITGYVKGATSANVKGLTAQIRLSYVIETATIANGVYTDVCVNGVAYNGETIVTGESRTLTFKVNANAGYNVTAVSVNGEKVVADENGVYTVTVDNYSVITALTAAQEYTITYVLNNGEDNSIKTYVYGDTVELDNYFTKEGFTFGGWFANEDLSGEEVVSIDTTNPENITLYAKWVEEETSEPKTSEGESNDNSSAAKSGCFGSVTASFTGALALIGFVFVGLKSRKKR